MSETHASFKNIGLERAKERFMEQLQWYPNNSKLLFQCGSVHDALGYEKDAIPYYERALEIGLEPQLEQQAYIQLGSSYRVTGAYERAIAILEEGLVKYPENRALHVFLSIAMYNIHQEKESLSQVLHMLTDTSKDPWIQKYKKAIDFYADHLDDVWE